MVYTDLTNWTSTVNIGDELERGFKVINQSFGTVQFLIIEDVHNTLNLEILETSIGTIISYNPVKIALNGNDFSLIGDGDHLFENGEEIPILETIKLLKCGSHPSNFSFYWGCDSTNLCEPPTIISAPSYINSETSFPNINLNYTESIPANFCQPGSASVEIKNEGSEITPGAANAYDIIVRVGTAPVVLVLFQY